MKYEFIDIGCGQTNVSSDKSFFGTNVNGLLVEPIEEYCKILPQSNTVLVECAAIGEYDGFKKLNVVLEGNKIEYIPYKLYSNPKAWNRYCKKNNIQYTGTSSFNNQNEIIYKNNCTIRKVKLMTIKTLLEKYNITEVDQLKIDVEGWEPIILQQFIDIMKLKKFKVNKKIIFEYFPDDVVPNHKNKKLLDNLIREICSKFQFKYRYCHKNLDSDIIMEKI